LSCLALVGCAGMDAAQCSSADWYKIAYRDAMYGLQPQDPIYETQCAPFGVKPDQARYKEGWTHGNYEQQRRVGHSPD